MANILANSRKELNQVNDLLDKEIPSYRQAYSDRTAWLMACLSELAYLRFNPLFSNNDRQQWFLDTIEKLVSDNKKSSLMKLVDMIEYDHEEEKKLLEKESKIIRTELVETFDSSGTQAILVSSDKFIVLAFRGTEAMSIKDIRTDLKAKTTQCETGGKIHTGFKEAFEKVAKDIQAKINKEELREKPLFITGHSLGGALATIAAKKLDHHGGVAACYTFGSPRVGNEEWTADIKAPLYRLVNAADCVPMLPPGAEIMGMISWLSQFLPVFGESISSWLLKFSGYLHAGNMRYLTNCFSGQYDNVRLLYSVGLLYRIKGWAINKLPWKKFLADHSISVYRKKLMIIAEKRNQNSSAN